MTDKELLILAANAADKPHKWFKNGLIEGMFIHPLCQSQIWNPLADDGDAFRLAVDLMMSVDIDECEEATYAYVGKSPREYAYEKWGDDRQQATRRTIVRAAAELGRVMKWSQSLRKDLK